MVESILCPKLWGCCARIQTIKGFCPLLMFKQHFLFLRPDRVCQKDITIKGIHIKKGWIIAFPVYAMHHDPELWENPEEFRPERY